LVKKVSDLERIVSDLQNTRTWKDHKDKYYQDHYSTIPTWMYQQPTTSVSSKTWTDTLGYSAAEISELLKDIKFDE
jgi:hypothetical protein